jgi:hypothetical protein
LTRLASPEKAFGIGIVSGPVGWYARSMKRGALEKIFLWPGNAVCDALKVEGEDHRLILRAFMNLLFYGTLGMVLMILVLRASDAACLY